MKTGWSKVTKKPYIYWLIGIFTIYLSLNVLISGFYETIQFIPYYLKTIHWGELLLSFIFSLTIAALISINSVYSYIKHKQRQQVRKEGVMTCVATVGGFATGICSACITGIIPLIFSAFGITISYLSLPFKGLEIQLLVIVLLGTSLYFLQKKRKITE